MILDGIYVICCLGCGISARRFSCINTCNIICNGVGGTSWISNWWFSYNSDGITFWLSTW